MVTPRSSADWRASATATPFQLLALSPEKSMTLRRPLCALPVMSFSPASSADPMGFGDSAFNSIHIFFSVLI
jgi:hypothetical protein